jgi:transcriptional regulator with XRE-family HTH domain
MTHTKPKTSLAPSEITGTRLREIRERRPLTQQQLADLVQNFGGTLDRAAVAKIEIGKRGVSLDEALQLAAVLGVSPSVLFLTLHDRDLVAIAPNLDVTMREARRWLKGLASLPNGNERDFYSEVAEEDWVAMLNTSVRVILSRVQDLVDAAASNDHERLPRLIDGLNAELERYRESLERERTG